MWCCCSKQGAKMEKLAEKLRGAEVSAKPGGARGMLAAVR